MHPDSVRPPQLMFGYICFPGKPRNNLLLVCNRHYIAAIQSFRSSMVPCQVGKKYSPRIWMSTARMLYISSAELRHSGSFPCLYPPILLSCRTLTIIGKPPKLLLTPITNTRKKKAELTWLKALRSGHVERKRQGRARSSDRRSPHLTSIRGMRGRDSDLNKEQQEYQYPCTERHCENKWMWNESTPPLQIALRAGPIRVQIGPINK